jgi:hypothetical protein
VSTDVDQKVDAVTKLLAEFESGIEVRVGDLVNELNLMNWFVLRSPNQNQSSLPSKHVFVSQINI